MWGFEPVTLRPPLYVPTGGTGTPLIDTNSIGYTSESCLRIEVVLLPSLNILLRQLKTVKIKFNQMKIVQSLSRLT